MIIIIIIIWNLETNFAEMEVRNAAQLLMMFSGVLSVMSSHFEVALSPVSSSNNNNNNGSFAN